MPKEKEDVKLYKIESYEGENDGGIIYIDVHYPIVEFETTNKSMPLFSSPEFWGKANVSNGTSVQIFKFEIVAESLKEAVEKYDEELERGLKELQQKRNEPKITTDII
jgi:hypothetical protein